MEEILILLREAVQEAKLPDLRTKCLDDGIIRSLARDFSDRGVGRAYDIFHLLKCDNCLRRWYWEKRDLGKKGIKKITYSAKDVRKMLDEIADKAIKKGLHRKQKLSEKIYRKRFELLKPHIRDITADSDKKPILTITDDLAEVKNPSGEIFSIRKGLVKLEGVEEIDKAVIYPDGNHEIWSPDLLEEELKKNPGSRFPTLTSGPRYLLSECRVVNYAGQIPEEAHQGFEFCNDHILCDLPAPSDDYYDFKK